MKLQARKFGNMLKKRKFAFGGDVADDSTMNQALADSKTFKEAFREARAGGGKSFTWRGKKYTTDVAKPNPIPAQEAGTKLVSARRALQDAPEGEGKRRLSSYVDQLQNDYEGLASELKPRKYAKGGKVKEAQMEMRHAKAMKKAGLPKSMVREEMSEAKKYARGGMPMKDGKPAFMQKKMNMGGMAKYARGGGIESRGKTKGTVIKMASGGSVSARADGCAQRGKTKGRML